MDDPDLDRLKPPLHYNCRSVLVAVPIGVDIDESDFITGEVKGRALDLIAAGFGGNITRLEQMHNDNEISIENKIELLQQKLVEAIKSRSATDAAGEAFAKEVITSLNTMVTAQTASFKELAEVLSNKQPTH